MRNTVKVKSVSFAAIVALTSQVSADSWHEVDMSDKGEFDTQCDYRVNLKDYGEEGSFLRISEVNPLYLVFHSSKPKHPVYIAAKYKYKFCSENLISKPITYKSICNTMRRRGIDFESVLGFLTSNLVSYLASRPEGLPILSRLKSCAYFNDRAGDALTIEERCD